MLMKFGMVTQIGPLRGIDRQNFEFFKKQDGGGRHLENHKNRDITTTFWLIFAKFGTNTQNGCLNRVDR